MSDKPKKKAVQTLFRERMYREGKKQEWHETIRKIQAESGKKFGQCVFDAMRALGYQGPKEEREIELARQSKLGQADETNIDTIRDHLPDRAPAAVEINWVLANGAMFRRSRDRNAEIRVTVAEVLGPPKCPSKAALTLLQHCVNQPTEFFKQFLSDMKRVQKEDTGQNLEEVQDLDLADVEKMLGEIS